MTGAKGMERWFGERLSALLAPARPAAYAVAAGPARGNDGRGVAPAPRRRRADLLDAASRIASRPGLGALAVVSLFAVVGFAAFVQSGGYAAMVARDGEIYDIVARGLGFPVSAVTITGQTEMRERELLAASGVGPRNSLPFLDAGEVRDRLMKLPLVKSARVQKLYPDRLVIVIEERQPYALWQRDGHVMIVAQDGMTIDELRDEHFLSLPFVVGEGADKRLLEYAAMLKSAGDLAPRVKAGVFVAGRRWNLQMTNGVVVKLPEDEPYAAIGALSRLQREARILDKDILSIDLRTPGRTAVRLTEEGVASREAAMSRKSHKSGG